MMHEPATVPTPDARRRARRDRDRGAPGVAFIAAQLVPMVLIVAVFHVRGAELARVDVGGLPMVDLLAASSVVIPLASQLASGVAFAVIGHLARRDAPTITEGFVRSLPAAVVLTLPAAAALTLGIVSARAMGPTDASAALVYVMINVTFAIALTIAYLLASAPILVALWLAFAGSLFIAPHAWWLPSTAGVVVALVVVLMVRRGTRGTVAPPTWAQAARGAARGFCAGLPLWSLPYLVYVSTGGVVEVGTVFLGMLAVALLYQVHFATVMAPLWRAIGTFHSDLEFVPAAEIGALVAELRRRSHRGRPLLVVGVVVGGAVTVGLSLLLAGDTPLLLGVALASGAGLLLIVETTKYSMIAGERMVYLAALAGPAGYLVGAAGGVESSLAGFAIASGATALIVAVRNRTVWEDAAYRLFWHRGFAA